MLAQRESADLARKLIEETVSKEGVDPKALSIHSDRGPSMSSKSVAQLLADLGVTKSHSRPHVSDDNPFSEAQFKTLKYRPQFPQCFGCLQDGLCFCRNFIQWYNMEHRHWGIALLTPYDVHHHRAEFITKARQDVLGRAFALHPQRFVRGAPLAPRLAPEVWINPPSNLPRSGGSDQAGQRQLAKIASSLTTPICRLSPDEEAGSTLLPQIRSASAVH